MWIIVAFIFPNRNKLDTITITSTTPAPTAAGSIASGYPAMSAPLEMAMATSAATIPSSAQSLSNMNNPTHNLGMSFI